MPGKELIDIILLLLAQILYFKTLFVCLKYLGWILRDKTLDYKLKQPETKINHSVDLKIFCVQINHDLKKN